MVVTNIEDGGNTKFENIDMVMIFDGFLLGWFVSDLNEANDMISR